MSNTKFSFHDYYFERALFFFMIFFFPNNTESKEGAKNNFDYQVEKILEKKPYLKMYMQKNRSVRCKQRKRWLKYSASILLGMLAFYKCTKCYQSLYNDDNAILYLLPRKGIHCAYGVCIIFQFLQIIIIKKLLFFCIDLFDDN